MSPRNYSTLAALLADRAAATVDPHTLSERDKIAHIYALQERVKLLDLIGTYFFANFEAIEDVIRQEAAGGPLSPSQSLILHICNRRWECAKPVIVVNPAEPETLTIQEPETGAVASRRRAV